MLPHLGSGVAGVCEVAQVAARLQAQSLSCGLQQLHLSLPASSWLVSAAPHLAHNC